MVVAFVFGGKVASNSVSFSAVDISQLRTTECFELSETCSSFSQPKKKKARAEATKTDIRQFAKQFQQAKIDEMNS